MLQGWGRYSIEVARAGGPPQITRRHSALADMDMASNGFSLSANGGYTKNFKSVLDGFINVDDPVGLYDIQRDIYAHDPICGTILDILSTMPFSDFYLTGLEDKKQLEKFDSSIENMRIKTLLPGISLQYLVDGAFIGSMTFNESKRIFNALTPIDGKFCELTVIPVFGMDPLINFKPTPEMQKLQKLLTSDERLKKISKQIPKFLLDSLQKGGGKALELNPGSTLYIPRRGLPTSYLGMSALRRVLMIHLYERHVARGSVEMSSRRLRSILHLQIGDDNWEPNSDDLNAFAQIFNNADMDPIAATIATRNGVQTNEIRSPTDTMRWDEMFDQLTNMKLKAFGISEAFLSGDANWSTLEQALSVFIEQMLAYREYLTRELFLDKMFPSIAIANDFKNRNSRRSYIEANAYHPFYNNKFVQYEDVVVKGERQKQFISLCDGSFENQVYEIEDITQYAIPNVVWKKRLRPEADESYLNLLNTLTSAGVPVPLRTLAAAGGVDLDEILKGLDEDISLRQDIKGKTKNLYQAPEEASASDTPLVKRQNWLKRDFTSLAEPLDYHPNGKRKGIVTRQQAKRMEERVNKLLAPILAKQAKRLNKIERRKQERLNTNISSKAYGFLG